jgi:hypothetical protein
MTDFILITFNAEKVEAVDLAELIDSKLSVSNWIILFSNTILLTTTETCQTVSRVIQDKFKGINFIAVEFEANAASGLMPNTVGKEIAAKRPK